MKTTMFLAFAVFAAAQANPQQLARQVMQQLESLPNHGVFDNLNYTVDGAKVTLFGQVNSPALKSSAEKAPGSPRRPGGRRYPRGRLSRLIHHAHAQPRFCDSYRGRKSERHPGRQGGDARGQESRRHPRPWRAAGLHGDQRPPGGSSQSILGVCLETVNAESRPTE